jgi:hypothetical protein
VGSREFRKGRKVNNEEKVLEGKKKKRALRDVKSNDDVLKVGIHEKR